MFWKEGFKSNGTHQFLANADDVQLMGGNMSFTRQSVVRQAYSFLQVEFSTESDLVLSISTSVSSHFHKAVVYLLTSSSLYSRQFYPSFYLSFNNVF
jgi:hypothetical protein